jgi:hypothetical protein
MTEKLRLYRGRCIVEVVNVPGSENIVQDLGLTVGKTDEEARDSFKWHAESWEKLIKGSERYDASRSKVNARIDVKEAGVPGYEILVRIL